MPVSVFSSGFKGGTKCHDPLADQNYTIHCCGLIVIVLFTKVRRKNEPK